MEGKGAGRVARGRNVAVTAGSGGSVVNFAVSPDTADASMNVLWLGQGGLGLPDRDYYLKPDFAAHRPVKPTFLGQKTVEVEIADSVRVRQMRSMLSDVRAKGEPVKTEAK